MASNVELCQVLAKKTHPFSHLHRKNYCTCRARLMFHGSVGMSGWRHFPHFPPIHAGGLAVLLRPLHDTTQSIFETILVI